MHLIDCYAHKSRLKERHPAEKLSLSLGMLAVTLLCPAWPVGVVVFVLMSGATLSSGVTWRAYLGFLQTPLGFALAGSLALLIEVSSGGVSLSPGGVDAAVTLLLRASAAMSSMLFLTLTTPISELLPALRAVGTPLVLLDLMLLMYRVLFLLTESLEAMTSAQEARLGYSSMRSSYRSIAMLGAALWGRVIHRASRLEIGLAARGYAGELRWMPERRILSRMVLCLIFLLEVSLCGFGVLWASLS